MIFECKMQNSRGSKGMVFWTSPSEMNPRPFHYYIKVTNTHSKMQAEMLLSSSISCYLAVRTILKEV